jgi:hypothetical protein
MTRLVCSCTAEHYLTATQHPLFAPGLGLARSVNAVRACRDAIVPSHLIDDSYRARQCRPLFLYFGAAFYEALDDLKDLGPEMSALDSVKNAYTSY